jgi:hypothetical protein
MSEFELYFSLGKDHILDYRNGYDHILFVVALSALYLIRDWKHLLILITAFTVGHSVTLAMATLDLVSVSTKWVEFLIPVTIFITAVSNFFKSEDSIGNRKIEINYAYALFFGLIHGLGFSNYLKGILGKDQTIIAQLFAFNLGLEAGQVIVVGIFMVAGFILVDIFSLNRRDWKLVISSMITGMALLLIKEKIFW